MKNLLTSNQTRSADRHTIENKPIASIDLMEAAAKAFVEEFIEHFSDRNISVSIYCGTGNNGGDGLAVARLLKDEGFLKISVKFARYSDSSTPDFNVNLERLRAARIELIELKPGEEFREETAEIIIDALLGTGLNKPLQGDWERLVSFLNESGRTIVAIDVPTGFFAEGVIDPTNTIINADLTITFQRPKINFFLPESGAFVGDFRIVDIGLDEEYIQSTDTPYVLLCDEDIRETLRTRDPFDHKGSFGHTFIIAGSEETMGAALLCAGASVFSGSGLTTACIPSAGLSALNSGFPEVMAVLRDKVNIKDIKWTKYSSVAIGPGLGISDTAKKVLEETLRRFEKPVVIDADAVNLISANYELMAFVPEGAIFTPHLKEFDRLFGGHKNWWERLQTGIDRSTTLGCTIVLKNRYTIIFTPQGKCIFNPTGNPAMASGGMGDVLTGMIASFLAQGYSPVEAAILGVYIHGKAGDTLAFDNNFAIVPASELIKKLPEVIGSFSKSLY